MSKVTEAFDEIEEKVRELATLVQELRLNLALGERQKAQQALMKAREAVNEITVLLNEVRAYALEQD